MLLFGLAITFGFGAAPGHATVSDAPEPPPHPGFTDVGPASPFSTEISWLVDQGVTTGWQTAAGTYEFRPKNLLSREAMAVFLYRLATQHGVQSAVSYTPPDQAAFGDVPVSHPFFTEISWLSATGIAQGWGDGTFRPREQISREATAAFAYRFAAHTGALGTTGPASQLFQDVPKSHGFYTQITWMAQRGITTGYTAPHGCLKFRPRSQVTREATAAFLYRLINGGVKPVSPDCSPPPPKPPAPVKPDCRKVKCVALTFDDGPGPHTTRLLDTLAAQKVPATFFLVGQKVGSYPGVVKRMATDGHEIGNHSWDHSSLPHLSDAQIRSQVSRTDTAIKNATGRAPALLRPPYGNRNTRVDRVVGKPLILWDVDTRDWEHLSPSRTISTTLATARKGSIVLMHDVHPTTVDAVPKLIKELRAKGFTFVTVTDLFAPTKLNPGRAYYRTG